MRSETTGHNDNGDGAFDGSSPSHDETRTCIACNRQLSAARLKAMPTASKCTQCVMDSGDVPVMRRHDQLIGTLETGEVISTYYRGQPNPYLQQVIKQQRMIRRMEGASDYN